MRYLAVALLAVGVLAGEFTPEEERFMQAITDAMCAEHARNWRQMEAILRALSKASDEHFRQAKASFDRLRNAAPMEEFAAADRSCGTGVVRTFVQFDQLAKRRRL